MKRSTRRTLPPSSISYARERDNWKSTLAKEFETSIDQYFAITTRLQTRQIVEKLTYAERGARPVWGLAGKEDSRMDSKLDAQSRIFSALHRNSSA
jgi:hypothetical protein